MIIGRCAPLRLPCSRVDAQLQMHGRQLGMIAEGRPSASYDASVWPGRHDAVWLPTLLVLPVAAPAVSLPRFDASNCECLVSACNDIANRRTPRVKRKAEPKPVLDQRLDLQFEAGIGRPARLQILHIRPAHN